MIPKCRGTARRALLLTLFVSGAVLGCDDDGTGPDEQISGRYELRTANGSPLPYTVIALGNNRAEILSGFLQVNADGTFSSSITTRVTQGTSTSTNSNTDSGRWSQTGNQATFTRSDGTQYVGVVTGAQIAAVVENISVVFSK
jgi:hypothetical protein